MAFETIGLVELMFLLVPGIVTFVAFRTNIVVLYAISFLSSLFLGVNLLVDVSVVSVYVFLFLIMNVVLAVGELV